MELWSGDILTFVLGVQVLLPGAAWHADTNSAADRQELKHLFSSFSLQAELEHCLLQQDDQKMGGMVSRGLRVI